MRDPNDCLCPGATATPVTDREGRAVVETEGPDKGKQKVRYRSNDPTVKCPVHPGGYDPMTGNNARG